MTDKRCSSPLTSARSRKGDEKYQPSKQNATQSFQAQYPRDPNATDGRLPPEVIYMLKSIRVLGHFEQETLLTLCRYIETRIVPAGIYLFRVGEKDDGIYVVQSGKEGEDCCVKEVGEGESIHSLLSILDVLTGNCQPYKTVSAVAQVKSKVLRLPVQALRDILDQNPESLVRVVQIIMVRLQRVTFLALHNYLGLSYELMKNSNHHSNLANQKKGTGDISNDPQSESLAGRISRRASEPELLGVKSQMFGSISNDTSYFEMACHRARVGLLHEPQGQSPEQVSNDAKLYMRSGRRATVALESMKTATQVDSDAILQKAKEDTQKFFSLHDGSLLDGKCKLLDVAAGSELTKEGDQDVNLYFVVDGLLHAVQETIIANERQNRVLFESGPGEIIGHLAVLTGEPSFFGVTAKSASTVLTISKSDFYRIMKCEPHIVLHLGNSIIRRISPFVRQIDFALDWTLIEAGETLFRQGGPSDYVYIVLNGRLMAKSKCLDGRQEQVGEYGRGDLVGIVEVLTQSERTASMAALRDTELAQIPNELLNLIKRRYPQVVARLIRLLGNKLNGSSKTRSPFYMPPTNPIVQQDGMVPSASNFATVALLAASVDVPLSKFTFDLHQHLSTICTTKILNSGIITNRLGNGAFDRVNSYRLSSWLSQQEDMHSIVIYQCDKHMTEWTRICLTQADCILVVAVYNHIPMKGMLEDEIDNFYVEARKGLILLHRTEDKPCNTAAWISLRPWCSFHHHIRCPGIFHETPPRGTGITEPLDRTSDVGRLARFLTGTSIGLVLSGGGARGLSHIGIVQAMQKYNIPIDIVGGTSIGSFIAALYADDGNICTVEEKAGAWSQRIASPVEKILDLTYPFTAMFSGYRFNQSIQNIFGDRQIEDLWIPYFCITTDLTVSRQRIHKSGCIWRYVRSSMSISGYLPPLCDPMDGHLLLDGCYVNNMPADVMKSMGAETIFAVDVGSHDDSSSFNYGDYLSGWWLLWQRWNPWGQPLNIPSMAEVQSRLAYVTCVRQLEMIKSSLQFEYIRPPIDQYQHLQFNCFEEIKDIGFEYGVKHFASLIENGLLNKLFGDESDANLVSQKHKPHVEADFIDLAELVSRMENTRSSIGNAMSSIAEEVTDIEDG